MTANNSGETAVSCLADDLLYGAAAIAAFLFGDDPQGIRRVYHLSSEVADEHKPPFFTMGPGAICCRKSTLLAYFAKRESEIYSNPKPRKTEPKVVTKSKKAALELGAIA